MKRFLFVCFYFLLTVAIVYGLQFVPAEQVSVQTNAYLIGTNLQDAVETLAETAVDADGKSTTNAANHTALINVVSVLSNDLDDVEVDAGVITSNNLSGSVLFVWPNLDTDDTDDVSSILNGGTAGSVGAVANDGSGNYTITFPAGGGGGGGGGSFGFFEAPAGTIVAWPADTIPDQWLECNGASVSTGSYPDLFAVIGTNYGNSGGSGTFDLPDYRGLFLRGHSGTRSDGWEEYQVSKRLAHKTSSVITGNVVGTLHHDISGYHIHTQKISAGSGGTRRGYSGFYGEYSYDALTDANTGPPWDGVDGSDTIERTTNSESQPKNVYVKWLIKHTDDSDGEEFYQPVGHIEGLHTIWNSVSAVTITRGECYVNGNYFYLSADTAYTLGSIDTGSEFSYIYLDHLNSTSPAEIGFTDTKTAPTWVSDGLMHGWYNNANSNRCVGVVKSVSGISEIHRFSNADGRYLLATNLLLSSAQSATGVWQPPDEGSGGSDLVPVNANAINAKLWITADDRTNSVSCAIASKEQDDNGFHVTNGAVYAGSELSAIGYGRVSVHGWVGLGASKDVVIFGDGEGTITMDATANGWQLDR